MTIARSIVLLLFVPQAFAQVPLGAGIVKIEYDENTVINFHESVSDKTPARCVEFFLDVNTWNIKDLDAHRSWLQPEVLWLDYSQFHFRCKSFTDRWLEIIVNNQTGVTHWIRRAENTIFVTWEDYLKDMFAIDRNMHYPQSIRRQPSDASEEIQYYGRDCFQVKSLKGDWIEIFTPDDICDGQDTKTKFTSGWIRWRRGDKLLINYYPTS